MLKLTIVLIATLSLAFAAPLETSDSKAVPSQAQVLAQLQQLFSNGGLQQAIAQFLQQNPQFSSLYSQYSQQINQAIQSSNLQAIFQLANQLISSGQVQISPMAPKQMVVPNFDLNSLIAQVQAAYPSLNIQSLISQNFGTLLTAYQQNFQTIMTALQTGNFNSLIQLGQQLISSGQIKLPSSKASTDLATLISQNPAVQNFLAKYRQEIQQYMPQFVQYWPEIQQLLPQIIANLDMLETEIEKNGFAKAMSDLLTVLANGSMKPQVQPIGN